MKTQIFQTARSRRNFLRTSGGTIGAAVLASGRPAQADDGGSIPPVTPTIQGCSPAPKPIPGGFNARTALGPRFPDTIAHLFLPGPGTEPSTIFDFDGDVAILNIHGTGTMTALDPNTGAPLSTTPNLPFATDVRFMRGAYVGVDGHQHHGAFAFF